MKVDPEVGIFLGTFKTTGDLLVLRPDGRLSWIDPEWNLKNVDLSPGYTYKDFDNLWGPEHLNERNPNLAIIWEDLNEI